MKTTWGFVCGLLLVAAAAIGGNYCGNSLCERSDANRKRIEKAGREELAALKARNDAELKAAAEHDERVCRPWIEGLRSIQRD